MMIIVLSLFGSVGCASAVWDSEWFGLGGKQGVLDTQKSIFIFANHGL